MQKIVKPEKRLRSGRPRNETARRLILQATLQMLQHETLQSVTIEAIAKNAGVSKATIYRWWTSKASIAIDAFVDHHVVSTPIRHDLPPGEALSEHYSLLAKQYSQWPGRIVAQILAEAQFDPSIGREFRERFYYGRRAAVHELMIRWRKSGELPDDIDVEMLMDIIYSPIYTRLIIGDSPLDEGFSDGLPLFIFNLIGVSHHPRTE